MTMRNRDRVQDALSILSGGLSPFVERELMRVYGLEWRARVQEDMGLSAPGRTIDLDDVQSLLKVMIVEWRSVFNTIPGPWERRLLGPTERALVGELLAVRIRWALPLEPFSTADVFRVVDSVQRLLVRVSAGAARDLQDSWREVLFLLYEEHAQPIPGPVPPPSPEVEHGGPTPPIDEAMSVLVFGEKRGPGQREAFEVWVLAHQDDGFYINCGGTSPMLHRARCPHLEIYGSGNIVKREKACSTSLPDLESWAAKRGWSLRYCLTCAPRA